MEQKPVIYVQRYIIVIKKIRLRLRLRLTNWLGNQRINRLFNHSDYMSLFKGFRKRIIHLWCYSTGLWDDLKGLKNNLSLKKLLFIAWVDRFENSIKFFMAANLNEQEQILGTNYTCKIISTKMIQYCVRICTVPFFTATATVLFFSKTVKSAKRNEQLIWPLVPYQNGNHYPFIIEDLEPYRFTVPILVRYCSRSNTNKLTVKLIVRYASRF